MAIREKGPFAALSSSSASSPLGIRRRLPSHQAAPPSFPRRGVLPRRGVHATRILPVVPSVTDIYAVGVDDTFPFDVLVRNKREFRHGSDITSWRTSAINALEVVRVPVRGQRRRTCSADEMMMTRRIRRRPSNSRKYDKVNRGVIDVVSPVVPPPPPPHSYLTNLAGRKTRPHHHHHVSCCCGFDVRHIIVL